jgi:B-box zinc finger
MGLSSSDKEKVASAVGGKTARSCDGCLRRRARWYCAADDAFLCQSCDTSVHSANPLARRHERLRLRFSSPALPSSTLAKVEELVVPAWYTRKARTPRGKNGAMSRRIIPESAESSDENKEEEHLLYHVPIFDPNLTEFYSPLPLEDSNNSPKREIEGDAVKSAPVSPQFNVSQSIKDSIAMSFMPSDAELNEFAADMEALLGQNNDDSFDMESLGLIESPQEIDGANIKLETDNGEVGTVLCGEDLLEAEVPSEMLDIDFDCGSPMTLEEGEEKIAVGNMTSYEVTPYLQHKKFVLNLNYEAIIASWGRSPWTDGERPQVKLDDCWPDYSVNFKFN